MEGKLAQRRTADRTAIFEGTGHVDAVRGDPRHLLAGYRVAKRGAVARRRAPLPSRVAAQDGHGPSLLDGLLQTIQTVMITLPRAWPASRYLTASAAWVSG